MRLPTTPGMTGLARGGGEQASVARTDRIAIAEAQLSALEFGDEGGSSTCRVLPSTMSARTSSTAAGSVRVTISTPAPPPGGFQYLRQLLAGKPRVRHRATARIAGGRWRRRVRTIARSLGRRPTGGRASIAGSNSASAARPTQRRRRLNHVFLAAQPKGSAAEMMVFPSRIDDALQRRAKSGDDAVMALSPTAKRQAKAVCCGVVARQAPRRGRVPACGPKPRRRARLHASPDSTSASQASRPPRIHSTPPAPPAATTPPKTAVPLINCLRSHGATTADSIGEPRTARP